MKCVLKYRTIPKSRVINIMIHRVSNLEAHRSNRMINEVMHADSDLKQNRFVGEDIL